VLFLTDILPTSYWGVENGGVKKGDTVVVLGCGPVGLLSIKWAFYTQDELEEQLKKQTDFETLFKVAPLQNPSRTLIKGHGARVEVIKDPTMQEIRYLDKLINELAKGKSMDKMLPEK
jgi:hypothetical protein